MTFKKKKSFKDNFFFIEFGFYQHSIKNNLKKS